MNPAQHGSPTFRETDKLLQTTKLSSKTSGFQQGRAYGDGKGWNNNPVLAPANVTSEYRDRFNPEAEFHRKVDRNVMAQMKATEYKYKFNK